jgi:hypothetical protein
MDTPDASDAVTLIDNLDPGALRRQLLDLERQRRAVRVLLRAAVAREKAAQTRKDAGHDAS